MATEKYYYCIVEDSDPGAEGLFADYNFESLWDLENIEYLAQDAAEDYFNNHDGWEADWPIKIALFNKDKNFIGKFEVELEHSPIFSSSQIA